MEPASSFASGAAPPPSSARRAGRCCLTWLVVAGALGPPGALAWAPFTRWFAARSDARARAHVRALVDEGLPVDLAALEEPLAHDGGPVFEALAERLAMTDAEYSALGREMWWRERPDQVLDPNGPPPDADHQPGPDGPFWDAPDGYAAEDHTRIVSGLLARLDDATLALDEALALDGWRLPPRSITDPYCQSHRRRGVLWNLLSLRALVRAGPAQWEDLARLARLVRLCADPTLIGARSDAWEIAQLAGWIEKALARSVPGPAAVQALEASLRVERRDALSSALRCDLVHTLEHLTPDETGLRQLEQDARTLASQGVTGPHLSTWPAPARYLAYLDDRARWARLQAEAVRAARLPLLEARRRFEALEAEARTSDGPLSSLFAPRSAVDKLVRGRAYARLARMALAWSAAAGAGPLPGSPPLVPGDPFADPAAPLRWRREGDRAFTVWSVGEDGVDDAAARGDERKYPADPDISLRARLP